MSTEMYIAVAALSVASVAVLIGTVNGCMNVGSLFSLGRREDWNKGAEVHVQLDKVDSPSDAAGKFARALHIAERYGKGNAFHITKDGRLLVVDAKVYLFAAFSGAKDFWELVAHDRRLAEDSSVPIESVNRGHLERQFAVVLNAGGKTYLDAVCLPDDLLHPYICMRATAEEFIQELDECCKRGKSAENREDV